jgi:hypothetical protein
VLLYRRQLGLSRAAALLPDHTYSACCAINKSNGDPNDINYQPRYALQSLYAHLAGFKLGIARVCTIESGYYVEPCWFWIQLLNFCRAMYRSDNWFCPSGLENVLRSHCNLGDMPSSGHPSLRTFSHEPRILDRRLKLLDYQKQRIFFHIRRSPKPLVPLGVTIRPSIRPWNSTGSAPGPGEKAYVQTEDADLSSYDARSRQSPSFPSAE